MLSIESLGEKEEGGTFRVVAFVFPITLTHNGALLSWRRAEPLPAGGKQ